MMKILLISSEDICRSRIAEALLTSFGRGMQIFTAGIVDGAQVPDVVREVVEENGREISGMKAKSIAEFKDKSWDFVITLCQEAEDEMKFIHLTAEHIEHFHFDDPFRTNFSDEMELKETIRTLFEEMDQALYLFYRDELKDSLLPRCTCGANTFCRCE